MDEISGFDSRVGAEPALPIEGDDSFGPGPLRDEFLLVEESHRADVLRDEKLPGRAIAPAPDVERCRGSTPGGFASGAPEVPRGRRSNVAVHATGTRSVPTSDPARNRRRLSSSSPSTNALALNAGSIAASFVNAVDCSA